jgi:hypothetical protein
VQWHTAYQVLSPPLAHQVEHLSVEEAEQEGNKHALQLSVDIFKLSRCKCLENAILHRRRNEKSRGGGVDN